MTGPPVLLAALRTLRLYATLGALYIALNSVTHPWTLRLQLTHLAPWPSEAAFGVACALASLVATFLLRIWDGRDTVEGGS